MNEDEIKTESVYIKVEDISLDGSTQETNISPSVSGVKVEADDIKTEEVILDYNDIVSSQTASGEVKAETIYIKTEDEYFDDSTQYGIISQSLSDYASESEGSSSGNWSPVESRKVRTKISFTESEDEGGSDDNEPPQNDRKPKKHSCFYCGKLLTNLKKHFANAHDKEPTVRQILTSNDQKLSKEIMKKITRLGDFEYNCDVMEKKRGTLLLVRNPRDDELMDYENYGPCPKCLGFLGKRFLFRHILKCDDIFISERKYDNTVNKKRIKMESELLLSIRKNPELDVEFNRILSTLKNDVVSDTGKLDELIVKIAYYKFEKKGHSGSNEIRQEIRRLSKLLLTLNRLSKLDGTLKDYLCPQYFDIVIEGIKSVCKEDSYEKQMEFPSLALRYGYSLKKCLAALKGIHMRQMDLEEIKKINCFQQLLSSEWSAKISSTAHQTLTKRKINGSDLLSLTEDLIVLRKHLDTSLPTLASKFKDSPSEKTWVELSHFVLTKVIMFNRSRTGEASQITISEFENIKSWKDCSNNNELIKGLQYFEIDIAKTMNLIHVEGKRGFVPILISEPILDIMKYMLLLRNKIGINKENKYFFARAKNSVTNIRGHDALRAVISTCQNLRQPQLITGTSMRKFFATLCQVMDMSQNQLDSIAKHLGQSVPIHDLFYRIHRNSTEMAKVAVTLIAAEKDPAQIGNKYLKDIVLNDIPLELIEDSEHEDEQVNESFLFLDHRPSTSQEKQQLVEDESHLKISEGQEKPRMKKKVRWTTPEKSVLLQYFKTPIKYGTIPRKEDCLAVKDRHPETLKKREWRDVKFFVYNQILKQRKKKSL